jgi:uncharacterized protein
VNADAVKADAVRARAEDSAGRVRRQVSRAIWLVLGLGCVAIGAIGIVVPGLPTTVFFIMAAWCFGRSSPRFEAWVLNLPRVGRLVQDHRDGLGMPRRAKVLAIAMMWTAITVSITVTWGRYWIGASVAVLGLVGTAYIVWRVPTRKRVLDHAGRG